MINYEFSMVDLASRNAYIVLPKDPKLSLTITPFGF
jgi:hypothetical protein